MPSPSLDVTSRNTAALPRSIAVPALGPRTAPPSGPKEGGRPTARGTDTVELSSRALQALQREQEGGVPVTEEPAPLPFPAAAEAETAATNAEDPAPPAAPDEAPGAAKELTREEQQQVRELQARDREVRAHEQAHKAAAGGLATGGPTFSYERGPDDVDYAVGGEVGISFESGRTPEQTIERATRAQRAALAPAQPSSQDRAVAARAAQMAAGARAEMRKEAQEETGAAPGTASTTPAHKAPEEPRPASIDIRA